MFVTHDVEEAVYLSDRVYVLSGRPGHVVIRVDIDLPRPRPPSVSLTARFMELKQRLLEPLFESLSTPTGALS